MRKSRKPMDKAPGSLGIIRNEELSSFGTREMGVYAEEVNLSRAVPDLIDGLKPVQRRIMWAASLLGKDFVKTARVVGDCIGRYHPHGDQSVSSAITTIVQSNVPTIRGKGNWGSLIDPAAAMRYCFTDDTRVNTDLGLIRMADLASMSKVGDQAHVPFSIGVDTKDGYEDSAYFVNSGIQDVVEVKSTSGYSVKCTPNEPFYTLTPDGFKWVDASELKPGDWLAMKRGTDVNLVRPDTLSWEAADFLGYIVGSDSECEVDPQTGTITIWCRPGFSAYDCHYVARRFLRSVPGASESWVSNKSVGGSDHEVVVITGPASEMLQPLIENLGVGTVETRRVPETVFRSNTLTMKVFLKTLYEVGGAIIHDPREDGIATQIFLNSHSLGLLEDVSLLLRSQFGIFAKIVNRCLVIEGSENVATFAFFIGAGGLDQKGFTAQEQSKSNDTDVVPFAKEFGITGYGDAISAWQLRELPADDTQSAIVEILKANDYYYEQVGSVEPAGKAQVWDLTVPESQSFVANGFLVHNTNCCLSGYGWSFFNPDYINKAVSSFVPNYDDTTIEPVSLPALMPNVLLNGGEGIGVGTTTMLPTFTPESVVEVCKALLQGKKLTAVDFARMLKYANRYGGHVVKNKANAQAWLMMFKQPTASVQFAAHVVVDRDNKALEIDDWPEGLNPLKFIAKIRMFDGVDQAYNHKGATGFRIEVSKAYNYAQFDKLVEKIRAATNTKRAFKINVTHRQSIITDGVVQYDTKYLSLSVPKLLMLWLRERIALEVRSLEYRIGVQNAAIEYSKLLIFASNNLDTIFKALRSSDSKAYLMKHLKLSELQANQILDLKVRQLSKLDQDAIKEKLKGQIAELRQLETWKAKPRLKVIKDFDNVMDLITKDRAFEAAKDQAMKVR